MCFIKRREACNSLVAFNIVLDLQQGLTRSEEKTIPQNHILSFGSNNPVQQVQKSQEK